MSDLTPEQDLHCQECGRAVTVELGLWTPNEIICTDCEDKEIPCEWCGRNFSEKGLKIHCAKVHALEMDLAKDGWEAL